MAGPAAIDFCDIDTVISARNVVATWLASYDPSPAVRPQAPMVALWEEIILMYSCTMWGVPRIWGCGKIIQAVKTKYFMLDLEFFFLNSVGYSVHLGEYIICYRKIFSSSV